MTTNEQVATGITRDEWILRYSARIQQRAGWTKDEADEAAKVGADEYERNERAAHNKVAFEGAGFESPENLADEEMSYWDDDGEE